MALVHVHAEVVPVTNSAPAAVAIGSLQETALGSHAGHFCGSAGILDLDAASA